MTHEKTAKNFPLVSRGDIVIIASLLTLAALIFALSLVTGGKEGARAVVSVNGKTEAVLPLGRDTEHIITTDGGSNTLRVENGKVFMHSADCPDKYCVEQGAVCETGEMIVCLPNRVTVTIEGAEEQFDAVAY